MVRGRVPAGVNRTDVAWTAIIGAGAALETWTVWHSRGGKDAGTLSHLARRVWRTDSRLGRAAFATAWTSAAAWVLAHMLRGNSRRSLAAPRR